MCLFAPAEPGGPSQPAAEYTQSRHNIMNK